MVAIAPVPYCLLHGLSDGYCSPTRLNTQLPSDCRSQGGSYLSGYYRRITPLTFSVQHAHLLGRNGDSGLHAIEWHRDIEIMYEIFLKLDVECTSSCATRIV